MTTKEILRFCHWWLGLEEVMMNKPTESSKERKKLFFEQCKIFNTEMFPKKYKIVIVETKTSLCQLIDIENVIKYSDEKYNAVGVLID